MKVNHDGCMGCIHEKEVTSKNCKKCKYNYMDMYQPSKEQKANNKFRRI